MLTTAEALLYTALKVTTFADNGVMGNGTGFFYSVTVLPSNGTPQHSPILITNKHVVEGYSEFEFTFHCGDNDLPTGETATKRLKLKDLVVHHPDPDIDLCAILIGDCLRKHKMSGKGLMYAPIRDEDMPHPLEWNTFDAIEEIIMIGCPRGLMDEFNKLPIARRGITATSISKRYENRPEFMVDIACFPGSSGSPIFIYNQNGFFDKSFGQMVLGQRLRMVGILHAGPLIDQVGTITLGQPKVNVAAMMHLGYAIRSSEIFALANAVRAELGVPLMGGGPSLSW